MSENSIFVVTERCIFEPEQDYDALSYPFIFVLFTIMTRVMFLFITFLS